MELALQWGITEFLPRDNYVTILVFMELALQFINKNINRFLTISHNPCFYGISFAILLLQISEKSINLSQSLFLWN